MDLLDARPFFTSAGHRALSTVIGRIAKTDREEGFGATGLAEESVFGNEAKEVSTMSGSTIDYSQKANWYQVPDIIKDADTFYVYATEYIMGSFEEGSPDYATLDNEEMLAGVDDEYLAHAAAFEDSTNVFVPYYRQSGLRHAGEAWEETGGLDAAILSMPYGDVTAALDYYFEHYNGGRPFVIAGHSQGSVIIKQALKKYFKEHPERYERMVAAYVIGYSVTRGELEANPHLKFATGEADTGVIVSYNTEGPKSAEVNAKSVVLLPGAISINPLNWKLDDTYAPASENKGSLMKNEETGKYEITDVGADAQVLPDRGVVLTHAKTEPLDAETAELAAAFFGLDGRHDDDYSYYFNNIKENVAKRIATYQAGR